MIFPSLILAGDDGKRFSFILLVTILLVIMIIDIQKQRKFSTVLPGVLLLYLLFYESLRNLAFYSLSAPEWRDLGEMIRIVGVFCAFYIGAHSNPSIVSVRRIVVAFLCVNFILLIEYVLNLQFLSIFYYEKITRFSGTSVSINYVFAQIIFVAYLLRRYKMGNLIVLAFFITSLGMLLFSGSRTSVLVSIPILLVLISSRMSKSWILILIISSLLLIQRFDFLALDFDGVFRLYNTVQSIIAGENSFSTFDKRIVNLQEIYNYAANSIWFGHGSNKSVYATVDNTYIMTIYRYGLIGLALELVFYIVSFAWIIRRSDDKIFNTLILASFFVAGLVSAVSYELRASLVFFYLIGFMLPNSYRDAKVSSLRRGVVK
jgi:hypothetical protein